MALKNWVLIISCLIFTISLFSPWATKRILFWEFSRSGFEIGVAVLAVFWVYPIFVTAAKRKMSRIVVIGTSILFITSLLIIALRIDNAGASLGPGLIIFGVSALVLLVWVLFHQIKYRKLDITTNDKNQSVCSELAIKRGVGNLFCKIEHGYVFVKVPYSRGCIKYECTHPFNVNANYGLKGWAVCEAKTLLLHTMHKNELCNKSSVLDQIDNITTQMDSHLWKRLKKLIRIN